MRGNKPSVILYTNRGKEEWIKEICAGIEEEGVLYEREEKAGDLESLAYEAARASTLGVGIAVTETEAALQMTPLEKGKPVFWLKAPKEESCRRLGANSARAVKRTPFKPME